MWSGHANVYTLVGEATLDNVDWYKTIILRMMAEWENEIRLKPNASVKVTQVKYLHYTDNKVDAEETVDLNAVLNVGNEFVY